jgi:hypothetical protein
MSGSGAIQFKKGRVTLNNGLDQSRPPAPFMFEDFLGIGATLADNPNVLISQAGTPTTAAAVSAAAGSAPVGHGGWVLGSVDNVDAEIDEVALGKVPWLAVAAVGNGTIFGEVGFVIPTALTARQYGFYLTDDETEGTGTNGSLNIQTGTTVVDVATDAAGFIFSSLADNPTHFHMANTNAGTQAYNNSSGLVGVVDRYTVLRVEIDSTGAAYFSGKVGAAATDGRHTVPDNISLIASKALAVATTALLVPLFSAAATTTTAVEWEIDYLLGGATV